MKKTELSVAVTLDRLAHLTAHNSQEMKVYTILSEELIGHSFGHISDRYSNPMIMYCTNKRNNKLNTYVFEMYIVQIQDLALQQNTENLILSFLKAVI